MQGSLASAVLPVIARPVYKLPPNYDPAIRELAAAIAVEAKRYELARQHIWALTKLEPDEPRHRARLAKLDELMKK